MVDDGDRAAIAAAITPQTPFIFAETFTNPLVRAQDFEEFDMILAMDRGHLKALQRIAPLHHHAKIRLFVPDFDVPDPYYGGAEGFEKVLDLVEERCRALLDELKLTF